MMDTAITHRRPDIIGEPIELWSGAACTLGTRPAAGQHCDLREIDIAEALGVAIISAETAAAVSTATGISAAVITSAAGGAALLGAGHGRNLINSGNRHDVDQHLPGRRGPRTS